MTEVNNREETLRESEERQAFLLKLSDTLRPLTDPIEIQTAAARALGEHLGIASVGYCEIEQDEDTFIAGGEYSDGRIRSLTGWRSRLSRFGPRIGSIFRAGKTVFFNDMRNSPPLINQVPHGAVPFDIISGAGVPLIKNGRLVAILYFGHPEPRVWSEYELRLLREVADRTWATVESARAAAAQRASEEKYRALFEAIDEGFCTIEVLFDENNKPFDYCFLEVNPAFARQTGLHDAVGKNARQLVPNLEEHWFEIYGNVALTGKSVRFENHAKPLHRWFDVYAFRLDPPERRQVGLLFYDISTRKQMEEERQKAKQELERRVAERTTQVRHLVTQLTMSEQEERRRISAILHDDLQQRLFSLNFQLLILRDAIDSHVEEHETQFAEIEEALQDCIQITRNLSVDISPPILQNEGLVEALRWLAAQMKQQQGLTVDIEAQGMAYLLDEDLRVLLFQTVRELLFNIVKHAGVKHATVALTYTDQSLNIEVSDNGRGFSADNGNIGVSISQGLRRIEQRLQLFGGEMAIMTAPEQGTHVALNIPFRGHEKS